MPSMNRSMSVPDTGSMWDMHTSASQPQGTCRAATRGACARADYAACTAGNEFKITPFCLDAGGEASLWDITMNPSTQGPTIEQLQKVSSAGRFSSRLNTNSQILTVTKAETFQRQR